MGEETTETQEALRRLYKLRESNLMYCQHDWLLIYVTPGVGQSQWELEELSLLPTGSLQSDEYRLASSFPADLCREKGRNPGG